MMQEIFENDDGPFTCKVQSSCVVRKTMVGGGDNILSSSAILSQYLHFFAVLFALSLLGLFLALLVLPQVPCEQ